MGKGLGGCATKERSLLMGAPSVFLVITRQFPVAHPEPVPFLDRTIMRFIKHCKSKFEAFDTVMANIANRRRCIATGRAQLASMSGGGN